MGNFRRGGRFAVPRRWVGGSVDELEAYQTSNYYYLSIDESYLRKYLELFYNLLFHQEFRERGKLNHYG